MCHFHHGDNENRDCTECGNLHFFQQIQIYSVFFGISWLHGNQIHSANRTRTWSFFNNFGMHRTGIHFWDGIQFNQFFQIHSTNRTITWFVISFISFAMHRTIIFPFGISGNCHCHFGMMSMVFNRCFFSRGFGCLMVMS
ncbi:hypothetical protein D3C85_1246870 [compost metagenome]